MNTSSNSFTIYNASAGSGKTFTLVKEYLLLLFNSSRKDAFRNILAITFTNKAVDEMKSRIIESLNAFSAVDTPLAYQALLDIISEESGLEKNEIKTRSGKILKNIIHNYAAFEISTIDGFTHRVLRTFAKDLGIPVNFEVELSTENILLEAVESLINKAGTDKQLTKILVAFAITKTDDDKSWDITRDLFEISKLLTNENNQIPLKALKGKTLEDFSVFAEKLNTEIQATEAEKIQTGEAFFALLEEQGLESSDFIGEYLPKFFTKIKEGKIVSLETAWILKLESDPLYKKTFKDKAKKAVLDQLQPQIVEFFSTAKDAYCKMEFLQAVKKNIVQLSLLNAINREIEEIKKERQVVLISEFNPRISAEVKGQPAPFIYERLGERYQNYFIDEFQDTSQMQWENLIPLIDHSLSGSVEGNQAPSLMLVGDAKQSIYRWRGGKAEQFIDLYSHSNPFSISKEVVNLPYNFRSGGKIVAFNNDFFKYTSRFLTHPDYQDLFKNSSQEIKKEDYGYVNISFIEAENAQEEYEVYPERVMEIIEDLQEKNVPKNDICILTRQRNEGIAIAGFLSEKGISVISSETLLVAQSPAVGFISDILAFTLNPKDGQLKLSIFRFLEEHLNPGQPHALISKILELPEGDFFNWLKEYDISFDIKKLQQLPLYESVEYIISSFSLIEGSNAHIQFYLDFVFETTQKQATGISSFLEVWEQKKDKLSIVVPEEEDAVQIMTIHKAKGLEFPVVIYPFANSKIDDTRRDSLWLDLEPPLDTIPFCYISASQKMRNWSQKPSEAYEELLCQKELDALNVLYVALTRASQQLYVISKFELDKKGEENNSKVSGLLIGYLKEIGKWNGGLTYEFGRNEIKKKSEKEVSPAIHLQQYYSSTSRDIAVNIITKSGSLWDSKQEEAIEKGKIIHDILSEIKTDKDVEKAISEAVNNGTITEDVRQTISETIKRITTHPQLTQFYENPTLVYNERSILTPGGAKLRPDRLNIEGKRASIIDYKTGKFSESHKLQLDGYSAALETMDFEVVNKVLIYVNRELSVKFV